MNFDDDEEVLADEVIENMEWGDLLNSLNKLNLKEHLHEKRKTLDSNFLERVNKSLKDLNSILLDNKYTCNINSGMSRLQEQRAKKNQEEDKTMKRIKQCLLAFQRDIEEFAHNQKHTQDNMLLTICLLRIIEECVLVFEDIDVLEITLRMLCILSFFDCSLQLQINSVSLQVFLFGMLEIYYYSGQQVYPSIKELLVTLLCQLLCYYQFVNQQHQDIDLVSQLIRVYQYHTKQQYEQKVYQIENDLIEATEEDYNEINRGDLYQLKMNNTQLFKINKLNDNKVLKDLSGTFYTMDLELVHLVTGTMATFSNQISYIPFNDKWDLYMTCSRYDENIFLLMVSIKILQSLALDSKFREDDSQSNQNYVKLIQTKSQVTDYFCISRECIRVYNNLLFGFDDLLLWLKFDTLNITNENSNYLKIRYSGQVVMRQYGDPKKLLDKNSLYYDQCGVYFRPQSGIEIIGYTQDFSQYRTTKKGLQLPNQITISFWFQYLETKVKGKTQQTHFNFHTLLCCSDGETPLICTDPQFMFLGVASVGNQDLARALDIKTPLTPGVKFFVTSLGKSLFTGWNNIIITIDNTKCESSLYINGKFKEVLEGVFSPLNITYIGNNRSGNESFGAVADLRVYQKILNLSEVKLLSFYDKNIKILTRKNIIDELQTIKLIQDLKKFIQDSQYTNIELCAAALECVSLMCFMSTQIRLESAKNGIFDMALLLLNCDQDLIKQSASQVLLSIR